MSLEQKCEQTAAEHEARIRAEERGRTTIGNRGSVKLAINDAWFSAMRSTAAPPTLHDVFVAIDEALDAVARGDAEGGASE